MFNLTSPHKESGLELARDKALSELTNFSADDAEYERMIVHVKTLTELIDLEKSEKVSPNTVALILGNIGVALLVIGYESKNVVTSKVLSFLLKTQ